MNNEELQELKTKIKTVMTDHLNELGYPDIEREDIMRELKPMWIKLEDASLVVPGMTFDNFCQHAQNWYTISQIQEIMGG